MQAVCQLKITLRGITPPIWRRVLGPDDLDLARLRHVFQIAMGWGNRHMHEFVHVADRQRRCLLSRDYLQKADADTRAPVCLKGKRACPLEDCGGPSGYGAIEEILEDPEDGEYASMLALLGGDDDDAEAFDLGAVNEVLAGIDWVER